MPFDAPFTLGPFLVDQAGRLSPDIGAAPAFRITWRGRPTQVAIRDTGPGMGILTLRMTLGRIPSTAASGAADARDHAFAVLRQLPGATPRGWAIELLPDHRILLRTEAALPIPASAASLVTELTVFLLAVDPYLTVLEESGLGLAASVAPAGTAKICPG